jgi:hypothetical protein
MKIYVNGAQVATVSTFNAFETTSAYTLCALAAARGSF